MFELRRLRQTLVDHYIVNKETVRQEIEAGSWELVEGCSFATEYQHLEQIAELVVRRSLTADRHLDGPTDEKLQEAIEAKTEEMRAAVEADGYYLDKEECYIVLGPRRGVS